MIEVDVSTNYSKRETEQSKPRPHSSLLKRIGNRIRVWRANFSKGPLSHKLVLLFLGLSVAGLASLAAIYLFVIVTVPKHEPLDTSYSLLLVQKIDTFDIEATLPPPPEIKDQESPINGVLYTKKEIETLSEKKPLIVMIENSPDARPQAGLSDADIVYESLVESGITRFMAVYWGNQSKKLGPIRSIRTYFLDWSSEFDDPPILHIGQAGYEPWEDVIVPEADARAYIRQYNIKSFMWYGRSITWRDKEKFNSGIAWEHVAYSDTKTAWDDAKVLGWVGPANVETLSFKKDEKKEKRPLSQNIEIKFLSLMTETYKVNWVYDSDSNTYKRLLANEAHIDENNNTQLAAKDVILQYVKYRPAGDRNGRIVLTTIGNGKVQIFRDGQMVEGVWEKSTRTDRTKYYDSEGNEIPLNRGSIWIEIIPTSNGNPISEIKIY